MNRSLAWPHLLSMVRLSPLLQKKALHAQAGLWLFECRPIGASARSAAGWCDRGLFRPLVSAMSTSGHTPSFHRRIVLTITVLFPDSIGDENAGCASAHFPKERHEAQTIHTSPFRRSHLRSKEAP